MSGRSPTRSSGWPGVADPVESQVARAPAETTLTHLGSARGGHPKPPHGSGLEGSPRRLCLQRHRSASGHRRCGTNEAHGPSHLMHCRLWLSVRTKRSGTCVGLLSAGNVTSTRDAAPAHRRTGRRHRGPVPTLGPPPSHRSEQAASSPGAPAYTPSEKPPRATRTPPGRAPSRLRRVGRTGWPALQRPPLAAPRRLHGGTSGSTTSGASHGPSSLAAHRIEDRRSVADA